MMSCGRFRVVALGLAVAVAVAHAAWAQARAVVLDAVAATVNGQVITASDVRAAQRLALVPAAPADETLTRLVDRLLMLDEVERAGQASPAPDEVATRRAALLSRLGGEAEAIQVRDGMTVARLSAWLRDDLRLEAYLAQRFTAAAQPTDEEVADFYATNAARFTPPGAEADDAATARARAALVTARRQSLIDAWLDGLRRRADIVVAPR